MAPNQIWPQLKTALFRHDQSQRWARCQRNPCQKRKEEQLVYRDGKNGSYLCSEHHLELKRIALPVVMGWSSSPQRRSRSHSQSLDDLETILAEDETIKIDTMKEPTQEGTTEGATKAVTIEDKVGDSGTEQGRMLKVEDGDYNMVVHE